MSCRAVERMRTRWQNMHRGATMLDALNPDPEAGSSDQLQEAAAGPARSDNAGGDAITQSWALLDSMATARAARSPARAYRWGPFQPQRSLVLARLSTLAQAGDEEGDAGARAQIAEARARGQRLGPRTRCK